MLIWEHDTLLTLPLTSTGFVRRECKKLLQDNLGYTWARKYFPSPRLYKYMRRCFRGGDTCANRWYMNETLTKVHSWDRSSSYPDVMVNCLFPCTPFVEVLDKLSVRYLETLISRGRAIIMEIRLTNVRLRNKYWGDPYLTKDKSRNLDPNAEIINGRILSAATLETVITEIDYQIIKEQYEYDIEILTYFKASKAMLPECLRDYIKKLYRDKTELKGKEGSPEETEYNERMYMKSKALLNSVYG